MSRKSPTVLIGNYCLLKLNYQLKRLGRSTFTVAPTVEKTKKDENNLLKSRNLAASIENLSIEVADDIEYRKPSITDDSVCRRRSQMSDYDYMREIKKICNPCDPYDIYEKTLRDLGWVAHYLKLGRVKKVVLQDRALRGWCLPPLTKKQDY